MRCDEWWDMRWDWMWRDGIGRDKVGWDKLWDVMNGEIWDEIGCEGMGLDVIRLDEISYEVWWMVRYEMRLDVKGWDWTWYDWMGWDKLWGVMNGEKWDEIGCEGMGLDVIRLDEISYEVWRMVRYEINSDRIWRDGIGCYRIGFNEISCEVRWLDEIGQVET